MTRAAALLLGGVPVALTLLALSANAQERDRTAPQLYAASCVHCHDTGGWGTRTLARRVPEGEAEMLKRRDLPPAYTRLVVRRGIGAMPPLTPTDITDTELDRLANWLDDRN